MFPSSGIRCSIMKGYYKNIRPLYISVACPVPIRLRNIFSYKWKCLYAVVHENVHLSRNSLYTSAALQCFIQSFCIAFNASI